MPSLDKSNKRFLVYLWIMDKEFRKELGKFFIDIAKLFVGGAVLSSALKIEGLSSKITLIASSLIAIGLALLGFYILSLKDKNK